MADRTYLDEALPLGERVQALIDCMTVEEKVSQLTNSAAGLAHLGVDEYNWWNEALHGVARAGTATVFPQAIGMAATWNTELMFRAAQAISDEARAKYNHAVANGNRDIYYGLTFWSPNVNIYRDPRWGRGQETYGEDPYLTSRLAVSYIRGMQGDTEHLKTAACAKHFAAHSGPEETRENFNSEVSRKDLNETYLPAFEACVREAKVETVMGAYNALNGVPCCCNGELLNGILRRDWGFEGHVVSDCGAIFNICEHHHYTDTLPEAAAAALKNGCDLNCGNVYEKLIDAYESDLVTEDDIDTALRRTLATRFKLGMFYKRTEYDELGMDIVCCPKHKAICNEMARESLVLLKNDGILPLDAAKSGRIAVIGPNADSKAALLGNYHGYPTEYITLLSGMEARFGKGRVSYAHGCGLFDGGEDIAEAVRLAAESDLTVLCLGLDAECEGEQGDAHNPYAAGDRGNIELPSVQDELLRRVCEAAENVILVIMCGGAVASAYADEHCRAVINAWYPGEMGGKAIAELLAGDYSPSGSLPVTVYASTDDLPDIGDYSMKGRTYKYYDGEVLYPFGYGLSYAEFELSLVTVENLHGGVKVSFTAANTGEYDAYKTVKLYLSLKKRTENDPIKALVRFDKLFINAGDSARVEFELAGDEFFTFDEDGAKIIRRPDEFDIIAE